MVKGNCARLELVSLFQIQYITTVVRRSTRAVYVVASTFEIRTGKRDYSADYCALIHSNGRAPVGQDVVDASAQSLP